MTEQEIENAIGYDVKKIEENEKETVILQRRSICLALDLLAGSIFNKNLELSGLSN